MAKHSLSVQPRVLTGRAVKKLRAQGLVPANIFGNHIDSVNVQVNTKTFSKLFNEVGESTLIYLQVEGEKEERPVLVREVVNHPVSGQLQHISLNQVNLKEKVTAPVSLVLEGEAPAVTEKAGILVQQLDEIEIEALPTDMPENITIDISSLKAVDDAIAVKDLHLDSSKIKVETDLESIIVKIEPLAAEEPVEAPAPAAGETPAGEATPAAGETPAPEPAAAEE
jgi:large subunit ribosomal protein L25